MVMPMMTVVVATGDDRAAAGRGCQRALTVCGALEPRRRVGVAAANHVWLPSTCVIHSCVYDILLCSLTPPFGAGTRCARRVSTPSAALRPGWSLAGAGRLIVVMPVRAVVAMVVVMPLWVLLVIAPCGGGIDIAAAAGDQDTKAAEDQEDARHHGVYSLYGGAP